ncbi:phage antirepressor KilAC domain-containing protein [Vibrio sp. RC27]
MKNRNAPARAISILDNDLNVNTNRYIEVTALNPEEPVMSSREIAEVTEKRHSDVMRDIRNMLDGLKFEQNAFLRFDNSGAKNRRIEYFDLNKELSITLVSGYCVQMRYAITKRWNELEQQSAIRTPTTMIEALELALAQSKQLEAQQAYIFKTQDDVEFAKVVHSSKTGIKIGTYAKSVEIGPNILFRWLRNNKILMADSSIPFSKDHNVPFQRYRKAGYFIVKEKIVETRHGSERTYTTLITGKGEKWLTKKLIDVGLISPKAPLAH